MSGPTYCINNNDDIICLGVNVFIFQVTVLFIALILLSNLEEKMSVVLIETINGINEWTSDKLFMSLNSRKR